MKHKHYQLKSEFNGTIVTKKIQLKPMQTIDLTFDAEKVKPENYVKYYELGFQELFDVIDLYDETESETEIVDIVYTNNVIEAEETKETKTVEFNNQLDKPIKRKRKSKSKPENEQ
jgi:hypothetical protein